MKIYKIFEKSIVVIVVVKVIIVEEQLRRVLKWEASSTET